MDHLGELKQMAVDTSSDDQQHPRSSKYIATISFNQSQFLSVNSYLVNGCQKTASAWYMPPVVSVNRGSVWQWLLQ